MDSKIKILNSFIWRLIQNAGNQVVSFIISIVLARMLMPEDYGLIAMITIFTNIAMVFINTGFSSAIVQKKDLTDADIDTIFYAGWICAVVLYFLCFFAAPGISKFYGEPRLTSLFRAESLIVILAASYSVQQAIINRNLLFKKSFIISIISTISQGAVGIFLAFKGYGVWSLVAGALAYGIVYSILSWCLVSWKPKLRFSFESFRSVFSFSVNILAEGLLAAAYNNIRSLVIGKQYNSESLAFYERGNQFPSLIMCQIDGAMTTVLFSALSRYQDDWNQGLSVLRRSLKTSIYVCVPMMAGLAAVAEPMVRVLLTDKWLPCVEYIQLMAIICMFWPLSAKLHAIKALGRADVTLKLSIFSIVLSLLSILLTYRISIRVMVLGAIVATGICQIVEAFVCVKHLNYKLVDQIMDILPSFVLAAAMSAGCMSITYLGISPVLTLILEIVLGVIIYVGLSAITKNENFCFLWGLLKEFLRKAKNSSASL